MTRRDITLRRARRTPKKGHQAADGNAWAEPIVTSGGQSQVRGR
jgi:hypothetical protein